MLAILTPFILFLLAWLTPWRRVAQRAPAFGGRLRRYLAHKDAVGY